MKQIRSELYDWHREIVREAGLIKRTADGVQKKAQAIVPKKAQSAITSAVQGMTQTVMFGSGLLTVSQDTSGMTLAERDYMVLNRFSGYRKTATLQGAGFGMGGLLMGVADLPVFMSIKIKFMFDAAKLYGYDPELPEERLFILHVFQLAFSSREHAISTFEKIERWDDAAHPEIDWEKFQIEYRDYLDFAKLLQLLPVVGSVAGGTANHKMMNKLRETVMNCYRMRILGLKFAHPVHTSKKIP